MNIFKVLNNGDGRINEPNVTAFLGYLLNPNESHGLNKAFLKKFVSIFNNSTPNERFKDIDVQISIEEPLYFDQINNDNLSSNKRGRDADIIITLKDSDGVVDIILIENKINDGAIGSNVTQLKDLAQVLEKRREEHELANCKLIFLTHQSQKSIDYFNHYTSKEQRFKNIICHHVFWSHNEKENSIEQKIKQILEEEAIGSIDPMQDYTRSTIKAFRQFILSWTLSTEGRKIDYFETIADFYYSINKNIFGDEYKDNLQCFLEIIKLIETNLPEGARAGAPDVAEKVIWFKDENRYSKKFCNIHIRSNKIGAPKIELYFFTEKTPLESENILADGSEISMMLKEYRNETKYSLKPSSPDNDKYITAHFLYFNLDRTGVEWFAKLGLRLIAESVRVIDIYKKKKKHKDFVSQTDDSLIEL